MRVTFPVAFLWMSLQVLAGPLGSSLPITAQQVIGECQQATSVILSVTGLANARRSDNADDISNGITALRTALDKSSAFNRNTRPTTLSATDIGSIASNCIGTLTVARTMLTSVTAARSTLGDWGPKISNELSSLRVTVEDYGNSLSFALPSQATGWQPFFADLGRTIGDTGRSLGRRN